MKKIILLFGSAGSFAHEAALKYFPKYPFLHAKTVEDVFSQLKDGETDFGLIPLSNSQSGFVRDTFEMLKQYGLRIETLYEFNPQAPESQSSVKALQAFRKENWQIKSIFSFSVEQNLLTIPKVALKNIKKIASHPQALWQCDRYLRKNFPMAQRLEWSDTATAAHDLAKGILSHDTAVIASAQAAKLYHLHIAQRNIENKDFHRQNLTTFLVLQKEKSVRAESLGDLRRNIDLIDREIIRKIAERMQIAKSIGAHKKQRGTKILDRVREKKLEALHLKHAKKSKLNPRLVKNIFNLLIKEARNLQKQNLRKKIRK